MHNETKIGKQELIEWVEKLLSRKNFEFKNLKDGDIYLQLFEHIWPNVMNKYKGCININPINDIKKKKNWKIIRNVLDCVNIDKDFINFDEIATENFKKCYQSLIILYFLYSLVKHHECDFILAYPIDQKLTDFMSSEEPLTCLVKAGSVQLPERFFEKISNSTLNLNNLIKGNEIDKNNSKNNILVSENFNELKHQKENLDCIDKSEYDDDYNFEKYINDYSNKEYNNLKKENSNIDDLEENFRLNSKFVTSENLSNNYSLNSLKKIDFNNIEISKNKEENYSKFNNIYYKNNDNNNNNNNNNTKNHSSFKINLNNKHIDESNSNISNVNHTLFNNNCDINLKKKNASYNFNDISASNNGSFFNYFNTKKEKYDNYKNKINDNNKNNLSAPNLNLFKLPYINDSNCIDKNNFVLDLKKGKVNASSQTENDSILNNLINDESYMNLEVIWNDQNKKIKGDSFISFLKTQIKMYKKELDIKREEMELIQKINKKTINDIKTSYNTELKKLKEKYEAEIFYLKQQHLENIVIVRKNFESKLNHIEEDLLLDLDVLNSENKHMNSSDEYKKDSYIEDYLKSSNYEFKENRDYDINMDNGNFLFDKIISTQSNKTTSVDSTIKENYSNDILKKTNFFNFNCNNEEDKYKNKKEEKYVEDDINKEKTVIHNDYYMNNSIEYSIKKLKYLLNEKNKEHILNNEYIKNEILNIRTMISKIVLEKENIYNYHKESSEIFNEILEFIEKNIDKKNVSDNLSKDFYVEKIKNAIYNIIRNKKKYHINEEEITQHLDESTLISLIVYMSSLLQLERMRSESIKIQKERNAFIMNYVKNENTTEYLPNKKKNITKFEDEDNIENLKILSNEVPSNEIENFEKAMELDDRIKKLENKNKKLLSINEYYKKKLEHVEIWKSTLENFKKKCKKMNDTYNTADQSEDKHSNFIKIKEIEESDNVIESSFIWFPKIYLNSFEEETEREAQLMYLLKKLGRCEKEQELNVFENNLFSYSINEYNTKNNEKLFSSKKNKICSIYKQNIISDKENIKNNQENNKLPLINHNEFLVILKKKLTYIFWQMLGDIYKYRNIIHEACNYIYNLNSLLNNYFIRNEQTQKQAKENFDVYSKNKENFYLSEKYRLRKIIGTTKLNMDIYKEQYVELKEEYEKEKKNLLILTNACYENENIKYKNTIQKFKEVDKNLKMYKAREKKWNKLVKLLTIELRNSSKDNQEEIKNVWLEIIATKQKGYEEFKKLNDEQLQKNNNYYSDSGENSNNFVSIIENINEKNSHSNNNIESNKNKGKVVSKSLSSNKIITNKYYCNYKKKINDKNHYSSKNIIYNKGAINLKLDKNDAIDNSNNNNLNNSNNLKDKENNNEINFYKNDFNVCLDDIQNNNILHFCSTSDTDNMITDKDQILIDIRVGENKNKEFNSNNIVKNTNKDSIKVNNFNTKYISNDDIILNTDKNWFSLLNQMAKESCAIFQNLLNLKEDELNEKKKRITDLEKELRKLKEDNMNQKNKYKCLEEQQEFLTDKINSLNENVDNLNSQIFLLNKDKIYLESRHLMKQQELSIIIKNYKNVVGSIRKHIKKYSSILYLLDNLPEEDEKYILDLTNIDEKNNSLNFSLDIDKNFELKKKEIINDDVRIKINAKDSQVVTNFSNFRISKLNNENKFISDFYINDLIKDIKCDNYR
ncbi:calponin homology domain-containing protein, putative [Plasmodium relictum]|uniref:Calponin homology domain-containing protein, putative n=1 Tax=Plasmodium relictum TaxID=85471 RepID=A0A1J1HAA7_PLARL|nr:calponin homology domain-containing protein, putative [Plasmodium relictum]CRH01448.1 calponin homology domain-containing protein, putative [Plasmodium relictum]